MSFTSFPHLDQPPARWYYCAHSHHPAHHFQDPVLDACCRRVRIPLLLQLLRPGCFRVSLPISVGFNDPNAVVSSHYQEILAPLFTEGHPTPFNTIREQGHLIAAYAYKHPSIPRIAWSPDYSTITIDSYPIMMASFGEFVISGVVLAEQQLTPTLQGFTFPELEAHIARTTNPDDPENWIREDVQNTTPGYSLISDKRNPFWLYDDALLTKILSNPITADKFMIVRKDGKTQPKIGMSLFCGLRDSSFLTRNLSQARSGHFSRKQKTSRRRYSQPSTLRLLLTVELNSPSSSPITAQIPPATSTSSPVTSPSSVCTTRRDTTPGKTNSSHDLSHLVSPVSCFTT